MADGEFRDSASHGDAAGQQPDEAAEVAAGAQRPDTVEPVYRGTGISAALVVGVIIAILAIILAAQNTDSTRVDFLSWDTDVPLVVIILAAGVAGVMLDEVVGFFWRHRRRRQLAERAELRRFRHQRH